jgi:hypothetical protein
MIFSDPPSLSRTGAPAARVIASAIFICCSKDRLRALVSAGACADAVAAAIAAENTIARASCNDFHHRTCSARLAQANASGTSFRFIGHFTP